MDTNEKLSKRRSFLLLLMAGAFLIWQVPAMDFIERFNRATPKALEIVAILGAITWGVALIWLVLTQRKYRSHSKQTQRILEDELVQAHRNKAIKLGYVFLMACTTSLFLLSMYFDLSGREVAHYILVIGVIVPLYAFAFMERRHA